MSLEIFLNKFIAIGILVIHIILGLSLLAFIWYKYVKKSGKKLPTFIYNFKNFVKYNSLLFAFFLTLGATIGSLIYSEIIGLSVCDLCWYQRALIYPQVIILGVALLKKNKEIFDYIVGLNVIGIIIGGYQYYMQMTNYSAPCPVSGSINCFTKDVLEFGYITIPIMSLTVFVVVMILTYIAKNGRNVETANL
ncbi:MAG: disulfide bond formation protein B [Thermoplasmata archaeon]